MFSGCRKGNVGPIQRYTSIYGHQWSLKTCRNWNKCCCHYVLGRLMWISCNSDFSSLCRRFVEKTDACNMAKVWIKYYATKRISWPSVQPMSTTLLHNKLHLDCTASLLWFRYNNIWNANCNNASTNQSNIV